MSERGQLGAAPVSAERARARRPRGGAGGTEQLDERGVDQIGATPRRPPAVVPGGVRALERRELVPQPRDGCVSDRRPSSRRVLRARRGPLARADPDDLLGLGDPDLAVADLAGPGGLHDGVDHALRSPSAHEHLDLHLGHEVHLVLGAAVDLGVAALAAEPLDVGRGEAVHADVAQGFLHLLDAVRLHDRGDELHGVPPDGVSSLAAASSFSTTRVLAPATSCRAHRRARPRRWRSGVDRPRATRPAHAPPASANERRSSAFAMPRPRFPEARRARDVARPRRSADEFAGRRSPVDLGEQSSVGIRRSRRRAARQPTFERSSTWSRMVRNDVSTTAARAELVRRHRDRRIVTPSGIGAGSIGRQIAAMCQDVRICGNRRLESASRPAASSSPDPRLRALRRPGRCSPPRPSRGRRRGRQPSPRGRPEPHAVHGATSGSSAESPARTRRAPSGPGRATESRGEVACRTTPRPIRQELARAASDSVRRDVAALRTVLTIAARSSRCWPVASRVREVPSEVTPRRPSCAPAPSSRSTSWRAFAGGFFAAVFLRAGFAPGLGLVVVGAASWPRRRWPSGPP